MVFWQPITNFLQSETSLFKNSLQNISLLSFLQAQQVNALFGNVLDCFLFLGGKDSEIGFSNFDEPSCRFWFLIYFLIFLFFISAAKLFAKGLKIMCYCFSNHCSNVVRLIVSSNTLKSFIGKTENVLKRFSYEVKGVS